MMTPDQGPQDQSTGNGEQHQGVPGSFSDQSDPLNTASIPARTHGVQSDAGLAQTESLSELSTGSASAASDLSPEFVKNCQSALLEKLEQAKEGWSDLSKPERAERMKRFCDDIAEHGELVNAALVRYLDNLPQFDLEGLKQQGPRAVKEALELHSEEEGLVSDALAELQLARFLLAQEVYRAGRNEFSTSTGLFDDMPRTSAWLTTGLGLMSLTGGIALAVATHGAVHHGVEHAVEFVAGHGALAKAAFWTTYPIVLFLEGIPVLGSSVLGPYLFGAAKTVGGRAVRGMSNERSEAFAQEAEVAESVTEKIRETVAALEEGCSGPARNLTEFFAVNNDLRAMASDVVDHLESGEMSSEEEGIAEDLHALNWRLGVKEAIEIVRFLNLRRGLQNMKDLEVRSQELLEVSSDSQEDGDAQQPSRGIIGGFKHAIATAFRTVKKIGKSSDDVGAQRAIEMTEELHQQFDSLPNNLLADPVSGLGSGISATLHMAFETGERPERALLDAVKGTIGILKNAVVGGVADGPSAETLFDVLFEMDTLKEGNKLRWGFKFAPTAALALLKKPALILKAEKKEEAKGKLSPKLIEKEMAEKQGRRHSSMLAAKEVLKVTGQAIGGAARKFLLEAPLHIGARLQTGLPLLKKISPACTDALHSLQQRRHNALERKLAKYEKELPGGGEYRRMSDQDFEVSVVQSFLEYQYGGEKALDKAQMVDLLGYWNSRRKLRFLEAEKRKTEHEKELIEEDYSLASLRPSTHPKVGAFDKLKQLYKALRASKEELAAMKVERVPGEPSIPEKLVAFVDRHNRRLEKKNESVNVGYGAVVDGTEEGLIVYRNRDGSLELMFGLEARRKIFDDWATVNRNSENAPDSLKVAGVKVLPNAYEGRLAAAMAIVSSPIEPAQRKALLEAHEKAKSSKADLTGISLGLIEAGFTQRQLFGNGARASDGTNLSPGLLRMGIIGDRVPTDAQLHAVKREVESKLS